MILEPLEFKKRPAMNKLHRMRRLARLAVLWENATLAFWRTDCWIGFFIALWLLQIPALLGVAGNVVALIVFLGGLFVLLRRSLKSFRWPDNNMTDRRLEQASDLENRPLALLEDRLANPDKESTRSLWKDGREIAFSTITKLRLFPPRPLLAAYDPLALRIFVGVILVTGLFVAGPQWPDRLQAGLFPFSANSTGSASNDIVLWVVPPEYTAMPQTTLQGTGQSKTVIDVPEGSIIKTRVQGWFGTPEMRIGDARIPLTQDDKKNWSLETKAAPANKIEIYQGWRTRSSIPINFIPDNPPQITLRDDIATLEKGAMRIPVTVQDDYGVRKLTMRMTLDPTVEEAPLGTMVEESRTMASAANTETEMNPVYNLAWHPWAGLPVIIEVEAQDFPGHNEAIPPLHTTLPERAFYHPAAKKLIDLRKRLIWTPQATIRNTIYDIESLLLNPEEFDNDIVAFLSLRSMSSRLHYDPSQESVIAIIEQLWDTALRIEEGNLSMAARDFRKAQKELQTLLDDPSATDEEIAIAMENMRQAMAEYFQEIFRALQKEMAKNNNQVGTPDPEMFSNMLNAQDLASFLDQLQAEALSGNRDSAQQLLSQLQQMMDGLSSSMDFSIPPQMQALMEQISALKELIEKQKSLLARTRLEADRVESSTPKTYPEFLPDDLDFMNQMETGVMPPPPQMVSPLKNINPKAKTAQTKMWRAEQEVLRETLSDLMLEADAQLGDIPENMQKAEPEMRNAGNKLGENRPDLSVPHQQQVLDYLQEDMDKMKGQVGQMMKQMALMSFGMGPLDPLGRPLNEGDGPSLLPGSKVKIPDKAERKRVQEILKTLRQRSGELQRPEYELEYYRRLMRQF